MPQVKFLHCADIHLDAPLTASGLSPEQAALRRSEIRETFGRIIQLARDEQVDLLFISGDLWEHGYVRRQTVTAVNELLGSLAPARVFIAPGNHDPFLRDSFYRTFSWADNVHIFCGGPSGVELPELGTMVYGYGFESYETREPVLRELNVHNQEVINFLVAHCEVVKGAGSASGYLPVDQATISSLGMDYLALGHIHQASGAIQVSGVVRASGVVRTSGVVRVSEVVPAPEVREDGGALWAYPGSPEPLGFDETGEHGVILGQLTKENGQARVTTTWVPLQKRSYYNLEVDISGAETPEAVVVRVKEAVNRQGSPDVKTNFYRIILTGRVEPALVLEDQVLAAALSGEFYRLRLHNNTFPAYDLERLSKGRDLVGLYIRKMEELLARSTVSQVEGSKSRDGFREDGPDPEVIRKALYYGLDALLRGEVQIR